MKIAVLSDTHVKLNNINILMEFLKKLPKVDMIIHSGDLIYYEAFEIQFILILAYFFIKERKNTSPMY
ncbi:metallophosphoesterase [Clostridium thermarum]|uniref:metallophosphoesterase n=1 Tax=Clostridium thermarum TaxID=1716543 RepID=UPI0013D10DFA|nr:metallophosphoesterase [Clostridium thermarum]